MCAIIGMAACEPIRNANWLRYGRDLMRHRGPDGYGEWTSKDSRIFLGHRRLAIFDLSADGAQPMGSNDQDLQIVFNGEIYNYLELKSELQSKGYRFKSQTDTEIVLAAYHYWGKNFLDRLNGMFAIALYDSRNKKLLLARDRAGEKPLFFKHEKGVSLKFSSELKGLFADPECDRKINEASLNFYLTLGYVPFGMCIIEDYEKLMPGHAIEFDTSNGETTKWQFWKAPTNKLTALTSSHLLLERLEELLETSVKRQLQADVSVGVLLSGGVDSSLIAAYAARNKSKIKTFNISFPGYQKFNEAPHARLIAEHFDTEHYELEANPIAADLISRLATQFDEPMADSSMIPTFMVSEMVRKECTVALGGDGGDELFGGYGHYQRILQLGQISKFLPAPIRKFMGKFATDQLPIGFRGRNWLQGLNFDPKTSLPLRSTFFDQKAKEALIQKNVPTDEETFDPVRSAIVETTDLVERATQLDFALYLASDILVKVDRSSMLNSLEVRAPFLDRELIEFAFSKVPSSSKVGFGKKKILLQQLAQKVLPSSFELNRKQGFSIPLASWLKEGPFRDLFMDVLFDNGCAFDQSMIKQLFVGQDQGHSNSERLFNLVLFELWRREYKVTF